MSTSHADRAAALATARAMAVSTSTLDEANAFSASQSPTSAVDPRCCSCTSAGGASYADFLRAR